MQKTMKTCVCSGLLLLGMTSSAWAVDPPTIGLGQAWPNATDVSRHSHFHAYVFVMNGIKYVQVNDTNGNVLGTIGTANGQFITLPIGRYAQLVKTPQQSPEVTVTATPIAEVATVYQDENTIVTATPLSDGTIEIQATSATACGGNARECSGILIN